MDSQLDHWIEEAAADAKTRSVVAPSERGGGAASAAAGTSFCQYWSTVRPVLVVLQTLIPKAAFLIAILLSIGDKACPKP